MGLLLPVLRFYYKRVPLHDNEGHPTEVGPEAYYGDKG